MLEIKVTNNGYIHLPKNSTTETIRKACINYTGLCKADFYLLQNGKIVSDSTIPNNATIHLVLRVNGGKGGFGSMLRAIGAQIEKTTNREACRDLSGRRLRDINEEKRLKTWIAQQAEREKEAADRKTKKLEKLCEQPKYEFKDEAYDKERSDLVEKVEESVLQGLQVADKVVAGEKRKAPTETGVQKKKLKLWMDADVEISSDDDYTDSNSEPEEASTSKASQ